MIGQTSIANIESTKEDLILDINEIMGKVYFKGSHAK
jgi:hypothetical protein